MPTYIHDCRCCTYLGKHNGMDLYYCPQGGFPTVIARYGNDGPDYLSGMVGAGYIRALNRAYHLAQNMLRIKTC